MILNRLFEPFTTPLVKKFLLIFAHIPAPDEYRLPFILPTATSNRPPASNVRVIFVSEREIRERVKAYTVTNRSEPNMSEAFIKSDMIHLDAEDFPFVLARGVDGKTSCVVWVRETPSGPQLEGHLPHKLGPGVEQQWHRRDVILTGDWWDYTECIFKCFYAAKAANTACDDPAWVRWILSVFAGNVGWKRICVEVTAKHLGDVRRPQIDQAIRCDLSVY